MTTDIFSQLVDRDVPPVPAELDTRVHQRLNTVLVTAHLFEFAFRALPQVLGTFFESVLHLIAYSLTGQAQSQRNEEPPSS